MATDPACPSCHGGELRLLDLSQRAVVDYYRCEACGHVWIVPREGDRTIQHVTRKPLREAS